MDNIFNLEDSENEPQNFDNISKLRPEFTWLNELNEQQKQAVMKTEGPSLILSGAGTGKTKVLTTRLAYILYNMKANPWNCMVVTFTNRAAKEMKERAEQMIGSLVENVWLGTFHSLCLKILRLYPELVGLHSNFTILDEDDQKRLLKQILTENGIDDKKYPPQTILEHIQRWKDKGWSWEQTSSVVKETVLLMIYEKYQQRMREMNCVDFGDILMYVQEIFTKNNDILQRYQDKFKYVMVDEYQDTNVVQYLLLRLLVQKSGNLCCVGDDDQSIYSWRGAEIENILRFNKDYPNAKIIRLEQNYRSSANILRAASSIISHNVSRLGKTLRVAENSVAKYTDNEKIKLVSVYNGNDEAQYIVREIENLYQNNYQYQEIAILVRTAAQTRIFEEKLVAEAIPYQVIGGPKFFERAEIRDILAYLRLVGHPDDDLAFERIINKPTRGIGKTTIDKIRANARMLGISMYSSANKMIENNELSSKAANSLKNIFAKFTDWRKILDVIPLADFADQIIDESGYLQMLKEEKTADADGRIENLRELVNSMKDNVLYPNLSAFLDHVSLVTENDNNLDKNKVMLITLHSAKGLEFEVVFLPGWEEGLFPHKRSMDEGTKAIEEERRLAYVAVTRAKQKLYILTAMNRQIYGEWQSNNPSRFINEIPSDVLNICNQSQTFSNNNYYQNSNYHSYGYYNKQNYTTTENSSENNYQKSSQHNPYTGIKVYHEDFGFGKIININGQTCEVQFEKFGVKKVLRSYLNKV